MDSGFDGRFREPGGRARNGKVESDSTAGSCVRKVKAESKGNNKQLSRAQCGLSRVLKFKISRQLSKQVWGKFAETLRLAMSLHGLMSQWQPLQQMTSVHSLDKN